MSTDVIFNADFPTPKAAAVRFAELWNALSKRPEFRGPGQVLVYTLVDSGNPVAKVGGYASDPAVAARVRALIGEYATDQYSFRGTWSVRGTRGARPTRYSVEITARSPLTRHAPSSVRAIDLIWDVGDTNRYTSQDTEDNPDAEQIISDLHTLIELGASSIWASTDRTINPLELYAVYHRDPNEYRHDGLPAPLPKWPIKVEDVEVAAEYARKQYEQDDGLRLHAFDAGPLVYSPLLARGTLNMFYTYLDRMMKAKVRADIEETRAKGYKAYECTEQQESWITVERLSDRAEIVRIDSLKQDGETLTIDYKIVEPGINDIIVRELVPLTVLKAFSGRAFRGSVKLLRYRNLPQGTEDVVPFEG